MARIFVTGGGGFIGRNTIPALLARGHDVVALRRQSAILPADHRSLSIVEGDLRVESGALDDWLRGCDVVLHLAGDTTPARSADDFNLEVQNNLQPLAHLLTAATHAGIKRFVLMSSGGTVYGIPQRTPIDEEHPTVPTTPYGTGKLAAEHMTRVWALRNRSEFLALRAANAYGPFQTGRNEQGVIGVWLRNTLQGEPLVVWGDGSAVRDYLFVDDLAQALAIACATPGLASGAYNIGRGIGHDLLEIANTIGRVTGSRPELRFTANKPNYVPTNILTAQRFSTATGWRATVELFEGIRLTHDILRRC